MRIAVLSFTRRGAALAHTLSEQLSALGHECAAFAMPRHAKEAGVSPFVPPLAAWMASAFSLYGAFVFVSACGVAVRAVAPLFKSKAEDPAVVVLDDNARFAISLLSGHIGGANVLARDIARLTGAQAVITTATDGAEVFSVDSWAAASGCTLVELPAAKAVSAALLDGETVGFVSTFPVVTALPGGLLAQEDGTLGICVSLDETAAPFQTTLHLVPRVVSLGIGCKRGTPEAALARRVSAVLAAHGISARAVCSVASIDLKADEPGLLRFCAQCDIPFTAFSAEELSRVPGEFSSSEFVRGVTGTDNVCERAAVLGAGPGGRLLITKQAGDGITVAAAVSDWSVRF